MAPQPSFVALSGGRAVASALVGVAFGLWIDLFRGHLVACRNRGILLAVEDGLFWLGATALVAIGLYFANWLDIRLYSVAAMAAGAAFALWLAGPVVRPAATVTTRGAQAVVRTLFWPVRFVARHLPRFPRRPRRPPPSPPPSNEEPETSRARPWWLGGAPARRS